MSGILYRTMFVLGIIAFIAVLIFSESGPTQPFAPTSPQFEDPFRISSGEITKLLFVEKDGNVDIEDGPVDTTNCSSTDYYQCLLRPYDASTYITLNSTDNTTNLRFTSAGDDRVLISVTYRLSCRSVNATRPWEIFFNTYPADFSETHVSVECPIASTFKNVTGTATDIFSNTIWLSYRQEADCIGGANNCNVNFTARQIDGNVDGQVDIAFAQIDLYGAAVVQTSCTGNWFENTGCQIGRGVDGFLKAILWVINGFKWIGEWFIFLGQHTANYIAVVVWLYAIPGMPTLIQGFVDVILTLWLGIIAFEIFKIVKFFG